MELNAKLKKILDDNKGTLCSLLRRNLPLDTPSDIINALVEQEAFNLDYQLFLKPDLLDCDVKSMENALRKVLMQNLSFDQDFGLVFLMSRNYKLKDTDTKILECKPSVNGQISLYKMNGALIDLSTSINKDENGLVDSIKVELLIPKYNSSGEIYGETKSEFKFDKQNFRSWQTYSHRANSTSKNPGAFATLSNSNQNYWNYNPNAKKPEDIPTLENPGGINPGFANTKCILHALKQAKLGNNPYGKRFPIDHRRYADESLHEDFDILNSFKTDNEGGADKRDDGHIPDREESGSETKTVVQVIKKDENQSTQKPVTNNTEKPATQPEQNTPTQNVKIMPKEEVKTPLEQEVKSDINLEEFKDLKKLSDFTPEQQTIINEALNSWCKEDVMDLFKNKYNKQISENTELKQWIGRIGNKKKSKKEIGEKPATQPEQNTPTQETKDEPSQEVKPTEVTGDDL